MEKAKKVIIMFFLISFIVIASLQATYSILKKPQIEDVLYYGYNCPHCKIVDEFIEKNNISQKIFFNHKEVLANKNNAAEMIKVAKICKLDLNNLGVPMLYYRNNCYTGDIDIIDLFKKELNMTQIVN